MSVYFLRWLIRLMLLAVMENQWVEFESADTSRFRAVTPGSFAFSTPYNSTHLTRF